jgi:hypothetical protein
MDNLLNGKLTNIKKVFNKSFTLLRKDIKSLKSKDLLSNVEAVYHLAVNNNSTYTSYMGNTQITRKMLEITRKKKI